MSKVNIENITKLGSNFASIFVDHHVLPDINFNWHCLVNNIYVPKKAINIYISCTLSPLLRNLNMDFTLKFACLDLQSELRILLQINTNIAGRA